MSNKSKSKTPKADSLNQKIIQNLQDKKPKSKTYFQILDALTLTSIIGTILVSGVIFGFSLWDTLFFARFQPGLVLIELWIIAFLLLVIVFWLYSKTDLILVRRRLVSFVVLCLLIFGVALSVFITAQRNARFERKLQEIQEKTRIINRSKRDYLIRERKKKPLEKTPKNQFIENSKPLRNQI